MSLSSLGSFDKRPNGCIPGVLGGIVGLCLLATSCSSRESSIRWRVVARCETLGGASKCREVVSWKGAAVVVTLCDAMRGRPQICVPRDYNSNK
jgi:hypothetical protein